MSVPEIILAVLNPWLMGVLCLGAFFYSAFVYYRGNRTNYWRAVPPICALWVVFYVGRAVGFWGEPWNIVMARTTVFSTIILIYAFCRLSLQRIRDVEAQDRRRNGNND